VYLQVGRCIFRVFPSGNNANQREVAERTFVVGVDKHDHCLSRVASYVTLKRVYEGLRGGNERFKGVDVCASGI
jgi:hypothetical protein